MKQPVKLASDSSTSDRPTSSRKTAPPYHQESKMLQIMQSKYGHSFGLIHGLLIAILWCGLLASVALDLRMPAVTAALYVALVVFVAIDSRVFQALVSGWQIDGLFALTILLLMLSLTVVLIAPFFGVFRIVNQLRQNP